MEHLLCYLSALTSKKCLFLDHVSPEFQWLLWSQTGVLTPRSECFFFPYVSLREGGGRIPLTVMERTSIQVENDYSYMNHILQLLLLTLQWWRSPFFPICILGRGGLPGSQDNPASFRDLPLWLPTPSGGSSTFCGSFYLFFGLFFLNL